MRTGKARTGLSARVACHRRRNACGTCLPFGPEVGRMRESRTYVLCGGRAMKRTSLPLRAALLRLLTAGFGTKGRSPPCTQIGRYRREADKPANELRVKSAALDPELT